MSTIAKASRRSNIATAILAAFCGLTLQACAVATPEDDWDSEANLEDAAHEVADQFTVTDAEPSKFSHRTPVVKRKRRTIPRRISGVADDIDRAEDTLACQIDQRACGTECCESFERCVQFSDPTGKHITTEMCVLREMTDDDV